MQIQRWLSAESEQMNPLVQRQVVHGANMTMARLVMKKGAVVPLHHHVNEQITTVLEGRLTFLIGGKTQELVAGESLVIPPDLPHAVEAVEDSVALDVFSPLRQDWLRGDDAYLRK